MALRMCSASSGFGLFWSERMNVMYLNVSEA